jgi:hypothetical protein
MNFKEQKLMENELTNLLTLKDSRPYVFRTRLERTLERVYKYSDNEGFTKMRDLCLEIKSKLNYISDQSNQTSDGSLKSFLFLESDIKKLLKLHLNIAKT